MPDWSSFSTSLVEMLDLTSPPIAITFVDGGGSDSTVPAFDAPMSPPTADGRTGRVPASCVFWFESTQRTFSTVGADHGNCSVGRWVHGFAGLDEIANADDVAALFASGWVTEADVGQVEVISERPEQIVYGPLGLTSGEPTVVLLRLSPRQMMQLGDALPNLELSTKPQCQIIAKAKAGRAAVSMGCALSRERTGMSDGELTCALPAADVSTVVERLASVVGADATVREYAISDRSRFSDR